MAEEGYINSVNLNAKTGFPYLVIEVEGGRSYPVNPGFRVMHWHEDLQFLLVESGEITVRTLYESVKLGSGDGILINRNVVHLVEDPAGSHYFSLLFPDFFLKFYFGSPAGELVKELEGRSGLRYVRFRTGIEWEREVLTRVRGLLALEKKKDRFYPYEVLSRLSEITLLVLRNAELPKESRPDPAASRMRLFLAYIEEHYAEDVTLDAIAESAHVSVSECLRCFKRTMQTTPYRCLMEYRLKRSAELLSGTALPIGRIAGDVGFNQASRFGKCFRDKTGLTPREYRERAREAARKTAGNAEG